MEVALCEVHPQKSSKISTRAMDDHGCGIQLKICQQYTVKTHGSAPASHSAINVSSCVQDE
jgi:hypothetical protein